MQEFNIRQADRTHFSGPLLHPSANYDEILGLQERHVQRGIRRSRQLKIHNPANATLSNQMSWPSISNGNAEFKEQQGNRAMETQDISQQRDRQRKPSTEVQGLPVVMENYEREHEM